MDARSPVSSNLLLDEGERLKKELLHLRALVQNVSCQSLDMVHLMRLQLTAPPQRHQL